MVESIFTPREESASYSIVLIQLKQQTEQLVASIKEVANLQAQNPKSLADLLKYRPVQ